MTSENTYSKSLQNKADELSAFRYDKKDYRRWLVTANMKSNIVVNGYMYLDGILKYARIRDWFGEDYYNLTDEIVVKIVDLPLTRSGGVNLCSMATHEGQEYADKWRKRFNVLRAESWKDMKKLETHRGQFKNYDMPIRVIATKQVRWVVVGDNNELQRLLDTYVHSIGKKGSQGYGVVGSWDIQRFNGEGQRHFPVENIEKGMNIEFTGYKPNYWNKKNWTYCVVRSF